MFKAIDLHQISCTTKFPPFLSRLGVQLKRRETGTVLGGYRQCKWFNKRTIGFPLYPADAGIPNWNSLYVAASKIVRVNDRVTKVKINK